MNGQFILLFGALSYLVLICLSKDKKKLHRELLSCMTKFTLSETKKEFLTNTKKPGFPRQHCTVAVIDVTPFISVSVLRLIGAKTRALESPAGSESARR